MTHRLTRMVAQIALLAITLAACGAPDPSLEATTTSHGDGPSGSILFVADGNVMLWDGDVHTVTNDIQAASPSWAPDGERFAFIQEYPEGYSDLFVANREGALLRQVTRNKPDGEPYSEDFACFAYWAADPIWSPVDDEIAYISDMGGWEASDCMYRESDPMYLWFSETFDAQPYILPAATGIDGPQASPTFSPDGNQLAFVVRVQVTDTARSTQIWQLDLNTAAVTMLVDGPDAAYDPAWSPEGDNIAFVRRTGTENDIWIVPAHDGTPYQLTHVGAVAAPTWSPDGRYLSFFKESDGNFEAWYVAVTAGADGKLTASEPQKLFSADNIDTTSGMSWSGQ